METRLIAELRQVITEMKCFIDGANDLGLWDANRAASLVIKAELLLTPVAPAAESLLKPVQPFSEEGMRNKCATCGIMKRHHFGTGINHPFRLPVAPDQPTKGETG